MSKKLFKLEIADNDEVAFECNAETDMDLIEILSVIRNSLMFLKKATMKNGYDPSGIRIPLVVLSIAIDLGVNKDDFDLVKGVNDSIKNEGKDDEN